MRIIQVIKNDFNSSRVALSWLVNREVPVWVHVLYYLAWMPIVLPLLPVLLIFKYVMDKKLKKLL